MKPTIEEVADRFNVPNEEAERLSLNGCRTIWLILRQRRVYIDHSLWMNKKARYSGWNTGRVAEWQTLRT